MIGNHTIELGAGDVFTAPAYHVAAPADVEIISFLILIDDIAGPKPAIAERGGRLFRSAKIALHDGRCADREFSAFARPDISACVVHDPGRRSCDCRIGMW